eukprot:gene4816-876_t
MVWSGHAPQDGTGSVGNRGASGQLAIGAIGGYDAPNLSRISFSHHFPAMRAITLCIGAASAGRGPCDILGAAGNECVAAHSTTRALYGEYSGPLYNVTRASDGGSADIRPVGAGGFADAAAHDAFCPKDSHARLARALPVAASSNTVACTMRQPLARFPCQLVCGTPTLHYQPLDCVISTVYDQSPSGNHLRKRHKLVNASRPAPAPGYCAAPTPPAPPVHPSPFTPGPPPRHRIAAGDGMEVYGMWFDPGYGYHVDATKNVPTGNDPESIYAVMSGSHYNGTHSPPSYRAVLHEILIFTLPWHGTLPRCGTMEAIYFGDAHWHGNTGAGKGPWVGADLEEGQGMYYGGGNRTKVNEQNQPLPFDFVTAYLRGRTDGFVLKGGDATKGNLTTMYDGPRPDERIAGLCDPLPGHGYQPMRKQGAIILATGGDFSDFASGKFYEGYMVTGTTSDETDEAVQANIISAHYRTLAH